ncbi:MAG: hypothetical protein LBT19_00790 [Candidatus Nomurabacteria bacterium]|nr:hypothetical protein [Candidatus Nomurabacteria bacterium]
MAMPKKIHYVWLGSKPLSKRDAGYIEGWKKLNPEFEVRAWSEKDIDLDKYPLAKLAYEEGRWALVADVVRMAIIYREGGIYFDTDVELLKPLDPLLRYDAFAGWESNYWFTTAAFGAKAGSPWIQKILKRYELPVEKKISTDTFLMTVHSPSVYAKDIYGLELDGKTRVYGDGKFAVFAQEYFSPKHYMTGKERVTENTIAFHHYGGSWHTSVERLKAASAKMGPKLLGEKGYGQFEKQFNKSLEKKIRKELP